MRPTLVHRSSLREQIMDALRDEVVTGRMAPGRRYTAREIAELYGVSATPVREAMVQLAGEGLLETSHLKGFQVRPVGRTEFDEILAARAAVLRGLAGGQELPAVREEALASARRRAQAARAAARSGRLDVLVVSDLRFWQEFGQLFGNRHLAEFLDRLRAQSWMHLVPHLRQLGTELAGGYWQRQPELVDGFALRDRGAVAALLDDYRTTVTAIANRFPSRL